MELKKSQKADLEGKRNTFFLIGLVLALGSTLLAFEWSSKPTKTETLGNLTSVEVEEEIIPVTREQQVQPPPPPPPPKVVEVLNIVEDDVEIEDELEIDDSEADDNTFVDVAPIIETGDEEEESNDPVPFFILEQQPEFPGGIDALKPYLVKQIRYPVIAQENGIQGKVYYSFTIEKDGSVTDIKVMRGVDSAIDTEAIRVLKTMPRWKPGMQRGKAVRVSFSGVINFQLQ
ncbi:energy transducer TonB [Maribellus sediminis]|uniref:energy transducer TonB n=1 Tax=Maribellus sediminis TaxID=2696285 RepID=UPI0014310192|nr:energy transducer TonB [Maribellus sediminis]